jgi:hypothetical protein
VVGIALGAAVAGPPGRDLESPNSSVKKNRRRTAVADAVRARI